MVTAHPTDTASRIREIVEPVLAEEGFELVQLEYRRGPKRDLLRLTLDRAGRDSYATAESKPSDGVTIDDCARVSKLLSPMLDVDETLTRRYTFEVSSPGLNRPLVTPAHFARAQGMQVRVKTRAPVDGQSLFIGQLVEAGEEGIVLEVDGTTRQVPYRLVSKANLEYQF